MGDGRPNRKKGATQTGLSPRPSSASWRWPRPHPCGWQLLPQLSEQLSGEGAGPGPGELGAPSCAIPGTLPPPIMTRRWPYLALGQASPQWESGRPGLRKPCVLAHWPTPSLASRPCPAARAPGTAPGPRPRLHGRLALSLCSGGPALTVPAHSPSLKASSRPAQLCQASHPLWASWADPVLGLAKTPPTHSPSAQGLSVLWTLWVLGRDPWWQGSHRHHRHGLLHMCGHEYVSGGWHASLAQRPKLIVGFGCDGGGGAGVTAEALTD